MKADRVVINLQAQTKRDVLMSLAQAAAPAVGLEAEIVFEKLMERERLGTTALGRGVAVPHARIESLETPVAVFARLESPVDFESPDAQPVDLLYLLLTPPDAGGVHLSVLAQAAGLLRDEAACAQLRRCGCQVTAAEILSRTASAKAA